MSRCPQIRPILATGGQCSQAIPMTTWEPLTGTGASAIVGYERKLRDTGPVGCNVGAVPTIFETTPRAHLGSAGYKPHRPVP